MAILVPPEQVPIPKPDMATPAVDFIQSPLRETPQEREQRHNLFRQSISPTVSPTTVPKNPVLKTAPTSVVDPTDASSGMDYLASRFTSPEQEERYRKASVNRQRILAIGDALRHIGNIYNTVNYAPSQQFNDPVGTEYKRYQTDKNARDAANLKYISYQQAKAAQEAKQRQWEYEQARKDKEFAWKQDVDNRNFGETRRKTDAYVNNLDTRTKNEAEKLLGIQADNKKKQYEAQIAPEKFELQKRNVNSQIASRADASRRGWANYKLSVARFNRGGGGSKSHAGTSKDRELFVSPDGSTYSFPKGTINEKNISSIYGALKSKGWFKDYGGYAETALEKWDAVMHMAGTTKAGHDAFIYYANRLGYEYEGGMDPKTVEKYWGTPAPQPAAKPKVAAKPATKPAAVPQGTRQPAQKTAAKTSGTRTTTGSTEKISTGVQWK